MIKTAAPGPGIQYLFKIALVVILSTLTASSLGAPTEPKSWWFQPCDTPVERSSRQYRSLTDLQQVIIQMKKFMQILNKSMTEIDQLYNDKIKRSPKINGYPKLRWVKMKKWIAEIRKGNDTNQKLNILHKYLQYYAGTLEVLRNLKIKTELLHSDQYSRDSIYWNITLHLRSLLCEVVTSYKGKSNLKEIPLSRMGISKSFKNGGWDLTKGHIIDISFFKKMVSFFNRTKKIFTKPKRGKMKKKNSAVRNKKRT